MNIPSIVIKDYLVEKFKDYVLTHDEFLVDSLFCSDTTKHLSININTGLWQCFKSKESGSFIHLVSFIEGIPYSRAKTIIGKKLFDTPELLFADLNLSSTQEDIRGGSISEASKDFSEINLDAESSSLTENLAKKFIISRKLGTEKFYIGVGGKYINRLIIPYEDKSGMFYFQARNLVNFGMKYLNPTSREYGVKSSEILFPFDENESYVVVTEGPLDALALKSTGVNATCIQGSNMSHSQLALLKGRNIVLGYDNDDAGSSGIRQTENLVRRKNIKSPYVVRPPIRYKDWGEFLVGSNKDSLLRYISRNVKRMDYLFTVRELLLPNH